MRNISSECLILNVTQQGENNRTVTLMNASEGIFYATLYGGGKSKLKSLVSPFNRGIAYLYRDESKNQCKLSDFDVKKYHPTFRESLYKSFAAALAGEIVLKSKCAGSPAEAYRITNGFLDGMDLSDENNSKIGMIRYLWRYIELSGLKPDVIHCCQCGQSFLSGKIGERGLIYEGAYSESDNGFVCNDCTSMNDKMFVLGKSAFTYLEAVSSLSPSEVRKIIVDGATMTQMKNFCFYMIQAVLGCKLNTMESGIGIL